MRINFITIQTKDIKASIDFYKRVLDFKIARQFSPRPGMEIVFLDDGNGNMVEFIQSSEGRTFSGEGISLGFYVKDIAAIEKHLKENNVRITSGPNALPNGVKMLHAADNNGLDLGFVQEQK